MRDFTVGVFAETRLGGEPKLLMHGVMPMSYAYFYCNLVAVRYTPDWTVYAQDQDGIRHGSMKGRRKYDQGTDSKEQAGRVRKLRDTDKRRGSTGG